MLYFTNGQKLIVLLRYALHGQPASPLNSHHIATTAQAWYTTHTRTSPCSRARRKSRRNELARRTEAWPTGEQIYDEVRRMVEPPRESSGVAALTPTPHRGKSPPRIGTTLCPRSNKKRQWKPPFLPVKNDSLLTWPRYGSFSVLFSRLRG